jgi:hypothetical protein
MATPKTTIAATTAINSKKVAVSALNPVTTAKLDAIQASITENMSSIREAASAVNAGRIQPAFGSSKSGQDLGSGGSTGGLLESSKTPGFDEGRAGGGYAKDDNWTGKFVPDPKFEPGDGWLGFSQNTKDNLGAASGLLTIAAAPAALLGPEAPVVLGAFAGLVQILASKGEPVPDAITGTFSGFTVGKNGVSFDPLTGMGPAKIQTLGQFTGDEIGGSGVLMTQAEVRSVTESLSKASGSYQKNPNPMSEPEGSAVIDDRNIKFMVGGGTAGPIMGGGNWLAGVSSASQFQLVATDALLA